MLSEELEIEDQSMRKRPDEGFELPYQMFFEEQIQMPWTSESNIAERE